MPFSAPPIPLLRAPANPFRLRPKANSLARSLAFFFVPYQNKFVDILRRDPATSSGTVSPIGTPFGNSWVLGTPSLSAVGGFQTGGSDTYYNQITGNALSLACGAFNHTVVTNPATVNVFAYWADTSLEHNGLEIGLRLNVGAMKPYAQITGASSSQNVIAGPPTSPPLPPGGGLNATAPLSMSIASSYDGTTLLVSGSVPGSAPLTNSQATSKTVSSLAQIFIGDQFAGAATGRPLLWVAGWFRALSSAELNTVVAGNGDLPPGLLERRHSPSLS